MPEGAFQIGIHFHVPELGDDEVEVGDGLEFFRRIMLKQQINQPQAAEIFKNKQLKLPAPRCRESSRQGKGLFVVVRSLTHAASCGECARYSCSSNFAK